MGKGRAMRGRLELVVRVEATREVISHVIAEQARREADGTYTAPAWARTRTSVLRWAAKLLLRREIEAEELEAELLDAAARCGVLRRTIDADLDGYDVDAFEANVDGGRMLA